MSRERVQGRLQVVERVKVTALLMLFTLLSGCTAALDSFVYEPEPPGPAPPPEGVAKNGLSLRAKKVIVEHLEFNIPSFDGIALRADVWKPARNGTYPVILMLSPYFGDVKNPAEDNYPAGGLYRQVVDQFLPHGYAVALVDLRGTRMSDGCLDLGGPNEQRDAYAAVEHLAAMPWSNGNVGMIGASYDGWTQQMAAVLNPPHLKAIVPIAPIADIYHGVGKGGAKYEGWVPFTGYGYNFVIGMGLPYPGVPQPPESPAELLSYVPLPGDPRFQRLDKQACAVENQVWLDDPSGDYNAWMQARDLRPLAGNATAAMFYVHGFADVNARPDHIDPWYNAYGGPKRAFLWQANHFADPILNNRDDWWFDTIRWFDHHLLGLDNGINATYGLVEVQDSMGRWRVETAWPPADATPLALPLGPGVLANATAAAPSGRETYRENPFDQGHELGHKSARVAKSASDTRLVYRSEPVADELHYSGRPVVRVNVETDRPNAFVVVRLYDIHPDGSWVLINRGVHSLRHRGGVESPEPAQPGARYTVEAAMQPSDHVFRPGHAIGLVITGADRGHILPPATLATTTVVYGGDAPSALVLPIVSRDTFTQVTWGPQQPRWLGPQAGDA